MANRPAGGRRRRGLIRWRRAWHRLAMHGLLGLALLLAFSSLLPPSTQAQGSGRVPAPGGPLPRLPEGVKPGELDRLSGPVRVMIELEDAPAAFAGARVGPPPGTRAPAASTQAQTARVEQAQQSVLQSFQSTGVNTQVMYRVQKVYNGVAAEVDARDIPRILATNGVKSVQQLRPMSLDHNATVPLIGTPAAWTSVGGGLNGQGVKIGIIDSGIDYIHRNFGGTADYTGSNSTITSDITFPTAVVAGGIDLVGDSYNGNNSAQPDTDPLDCGGHGSHVAGSAAGRGVTTGNATFTGPYDNTVPFNSLKIGPGVAPAATLYAIKVFGCSGTTAYATAALEWALDPDGNADFSDRMDVVNMSLGSPFASAEDPTIVSANNAALIGMIVVGSAGNSGDTTAITGSPASATRSISVAASNDSQVHTDAIGVTAPGGIVGTYPGSASVAFNWRAMPSDVTRPVAYAGAAVSGCGAFAPGTFTGQIAMIEWIPTGSTTSPCGSAVRTANARNAGADGVILLYNAPTVDITIAGTNQIPTIIVGSNVATTLKSNLGGLTVTLSKSYLNSQLLTDAAQEDRIADFSSRGPTTRNGALKPDVSAPGVTVFSTATLTGTEGLSQNGTSMAAPHVAGVMGLLRQQHPTWTVEELKALVMNTATHDVFSGVNHGTPQMATSRMGAGRVDVGTAVTSSLVAYETDEGGRVSVSFGAVDSLGASTLTRTVQVVNKGGSALSFTVAYAPITSVAGTSVTFPDGTSFNLAGNASTTFRVQLNMDGAQMKNSRDPSMAAIQETVNRQYLAEVTGQVTVNPSGGPNLRVPLYAAV